MTIIFKVQAIRTDGETRTYDRTKINHALRTLWRQKNIVTANLTFMENHVRWWVFAKFERKRALATGLDGLEMPSGRPPIDGHLGWKRFPNKWNKVK